MCFQPLQRSLPALGAPDPIYHDEVCGMSNRRDIVTTHADFTQSFETIVAMIYEGLPGQKSDYSKGAQTGVAFVGGYIAGILCAIVSHPADVMVSKLNANRQPGEAFGSAMSRIYGDIGFKGLWNGLPVRIVMIGTLTGECYGIYFPECR